MSASFKTFKLHTFKCSQKQKHLEYSFNGTVKGGRRGENRNVQASVCHNFSAERGIKGELGKTQSCLVGKITEVASRKLEARTNPNICRFPGELAVAETKAWLFHLREEMNTADNRLLGEGGSA